MKQHHTKLQTVCCVLLWCCTAACVGVIWHLSAQTSTDSAALSGGLLSRLEALFGITLSQHFVRKTAHALEYLGLCLLFSGSLHLTLFAPQYVLSFFGTAMCAAVDEIHQYFVTGRACQPRDVYVDCIGALAGMICYWILWSVLKNFRKERV